MLHNSILHVRFSREVLGHTENAEMRVKYNESLTNSGKHSMFTRTSLPD